MTDDRNIAYTALQSGTAVLDSAGEPFGTVAHVLQDESLDLFDGVVVTTPGGLRFLDASQVTSISDDAVHSSVAPELTGSLPEPDGAPVYTVDALQDTGDSLTARLGRIFRREHWTLKE